MHRQPLLGAPAARRGAVGPLARDRRMDCLLYTSDAADDLLCVDLGGRRIIKKNIYSTQLSLPTLTPVHTSVFYDPLKRT